MAIVYINNCRYKIHDYNFRYGKPSAPVILNKYWTQDKLSIQNL
jgi:hypothetical protein